MLNQEMVCFMQMDHLQSSTIDDIIHQYFNMFKESEDELLLSHNIKNVVLDKLNDFEKKLFVLSIIQGLTLRQVGDILSLSYRQAQYYCKKLSNKIYEEVYKNGD